MKFLEKYDLFLFDFDGVIVDSIDIHATSLNRLTGKDIGRDLLFRIQKGNFFKESENIDALKRVDWGEYKEFIEEHILKKAPFQSVPAVLRELRNNNKLNIIISSGSVDIIKRFIEFHNLEYFDEILGFEFHQSKSYKINYVINKYNVEKHKVLFITDTLGDVIEAKEVGVDSVGVLYGLHDEKTLSLGKPIKCIGCLDELIQK